MVRLHEHDLSDPLAQLTPTGWSWWHLALRCRLLAVVVAALSLGGAAEAAPGSRPSRIAVQIEGPQASASRDAALGLLPDTIEVVEQASFRRALAVAGLPGGTLGYALTSPRLRPALLRIVRRAVRNEGLGGALVGRTRGGRRGLELVVVYVEAEGDPLIDTTVPQRGAHQERQRALEPVMQVVVDVLAPVVAEPEPPDGVGDEVAEPVVDPDAEAQVAPDAEEGEPFEYVASRPGSELLSLGLGLGFGGRFFSYSDAVPRSTNLRDYDVFGVPILRVGGALYPGATTGVPFVRDLGITVEYAHAVGLSSATADGRNRFGTHWSRFWGGLRYRFRAGDEAQPFVVGLSGRAGFHRFTFAPQDDDAAAIADQVAEVEYVLLRAGLDVRLPLAEVVGLLLSVGYDGPLEGGATYNRFRDHSLAGVDAGLGLEVALGSGFGLEFGAEYAGVFASLSADPADSYVASAASDHSVTLSLGAGYRY